MIKTEISVVLESIRMPKDAANGNAYAAFLFTGGKIDVPLTLEQIKQLQGMEGEDMVCAFSMRPRAIVLFGRASTVFEPAKFIGIIS